MKKLIAPVIKSWYVTHDVRSFQLYKNSECPFDPGQAAEVSINKSGWEDEKRPFTFTSQPDDEYLEFIIKIYQGHGGVTNELKNVRLGDELILHDVFGAIRYEGEGLFIAGGAGITPFISILRMLQREGKNSGNHLLFGNKTESDIILKDELSDMLGDRFVNVLSEEKVEAFHHGFIDRELLKEYTGEKDRKYYICGPPPMVEKVTADLDALGIKEGNIIQEDL
jgi:ferredoxin-NADP reductase